MKLKLCGNIGQIIESIRDNQNISVFGMPFYSRQIVASQLESFLYVCPDYVKASDAFTQLKSLRDDVVYIPSIDDVLSVYKSSLDSSLTRLSSIAAICSGRAKIAVTSVLGFMQLYPKKQDVLSHIISIKKDQTINLEQLLKTLLSSGYSRTSQCELPGQFSLRGDILDITPIGKTKGIRIDFFDELVERIRYIDLDTQLARGELQSVIIPPNTEIFNLKKDAIEIIKRSINPKLEPQYFSRQQDIAQELIIKIESGSFSGLNCLKPLSDTQPLSEYFPLVIFDEQKQCVDNFNAHIQEHNSRLSSLLERGETLSFVKNQLVDSLSVQTTALTFDKLLSQNRIFSPKKIFNFSDQPISSYAKNLKGLADDLKMWLSGGYEIDIYCSGELSKNLKDFLSQHYLPTSIVKEGSLYKGGIFFEQKQVIIGSGDLVSRQKPAPVKKSSKKAEFFLPSPGDYVVHNTHGIGICEGLEVMKLGESERDFVVIRYDGGDKLYVAATSINLLSAYAGQEQPRLNKIGGAEFARIKEKVKKSIEKMAFDLRELYAQRESAKGHKYNSDNSGLAEFEADFPFVETPDQLTAISECLDDLTSGKIMDRLLCGDVGYGKTEVAMRVAYKVILEGKQVAFISPTTILARQHYKTLKERMEKFGVVVQSLTRFDSPAAVKNTLSELKKGRVDIVCGTHRVLSSDVSFKNLGLLVLDEEQRFGVADKEKIKLLKTDANVLSLSATPIPRTLHMALSGIRDISMLTIPPPSRIPVSTYVAPYSQSLVYDAVMREIGRGGQVFIVYNRVEKMDRYASEIVNLFPNLTVGIAHGQMEKRRLEDTLTKFSEREIDILITSTIIENGIDLSNVNTMIVVNADMLGLSQMYQLRGRIGRGDRLAYAFFTYDDKKVLTENAYKRLDAITSYTDFGSGFKLAMRDLEIRGAGNLLGKEQHGHMQKVGYEMYLKLIQEVMDEVSGKQRQESQEANIITDFPAFIPEDYITDINWRLKIYKRIGTVKTPKEANAELSRLKDVYGSPPRAVKNLLTVSIIKNCAQELGAEKVVLTRKKCEILFEKSSLNLELIKLAVSFGFNYSAANSSIFISPSAKTIKILIDFLCSATQKLFA